MCRYVCMHAYDFAEPWVNANISPPRPSIPCRFVFKTKVMFSLGVPGITGKSRFDPIIAGLGTIRAHI